jgi:tetratricopeptide (TPR) repeat protein
MLLVGLTLWRYRSRMSAKPHAFVAMPFGPKRAADDTLIDFNRVYAEYIGPALADAGFEAMRADQEQRAGDIRTDMFQELLVADLVVADLTIDNPNVWYELGVRHALRARGVVLVFGSKAPAAFDLYTDRKLRYSLKQGAPDPETLKADREALCQMLKATMESWHGRKLSPVYNLLPNLQEPDWKSLRIGDVREFWERHDAWGNQLELARKAGHIGDVLVLADEAPVAAFRAEAWIKAGVALRKAEQFQYAFEHFEQGLKIAPHNVMARREIGICLQRLALEGAAGHSLDRARAHYRSALQDLPRDPETWALLGRVDKDAWTETWAQPHLETRTLDQVKEEAWYQEPLLRAAIESYATGYRMNPGHYYSGINALTLMCLHRHLADESRYDDQIQTMAGAVRFGAENEPDEQQRFWALSTLGDLAVLVDSAAAVGKAYREAIAKNDKDWFALRSTRAQLLLLQQLGFRPEAVGKGLETLDRALERMREPARRWQPRQVLLFSGHRVDDPGRATPRFPQDKAALAGREIREALEKLGAGAEDLALCQGAAGGDLLFLEAAQARGVRCQLMLPFREPEFIDHSIMPCVSGEEWRERFYAVKSKEAALRVMPQELGALPSGVDSFERCNLWLLYTALAHGIDKVRFIALWNGAKGDGKGGTEHMYQEVKRRTGRVTWLDTTKLW